MTLALVGGTHRTVPLDLRERLAFSAAQAAEALDATLVNMRFIKPLDVELLRDVATRHDALVTVEENAVMGGAGSGVLEALADLGIERPVVLLGLPDRFIDHGDHGKLLAGLGLDAAGIAQAVRARCFGDARALQSVA